MPMMKKAAIFVRAQTVRSSTKESITANERTIDAQFYALRIWYHFIALYLCDS